MLNHLPASCARQELAAGELSLLPKSPPRSSPGRPPSPSTHKQIVQEIRPAASRSTPGRRRFSWSKRRFEAPAAQDRLHLRGRPVGIRICWMISGQRIASPDDLSRLQSLFAGRGCISSRGGDVIANASAYKSHRPGGGRLNHIIFCRDGSADHAALSAAIREGCASGLPPFYGRSAPRASAPLGRPESRYLHARRARRAGMYIYECGLYNRSPELKNVLRREGCISGPLRTATRPCRRPPRACRGKRTPGAALLLARPARLLGWAAGHPILLDDLYAALGSLEACSYVRQHVSGQILLVDGWWVPDMDDAAERLRMLLNELLARSLEQGSTYALCRCRKTRRAAGRAAAAGLCRRGGGRGDLLRRHAATVHAPAGRHALHQAPAQGCPRRAAGRPGNEPPGCAGGLNAMFPGKLLLCFDTGMLNQAIAQRIDR